MADSYSLPSWKARTCRMAGAIFLLTALLGGCVTAMQAAVPGWTMACEPGRGCVRQPSVLTLLPEESRAALRNDPAAIAALSSHVGDPLVRAALAGLVLVRGGLMAFLLLAIGTTLRRLGSAGDRILERGLPWFRRGALAALLWSIAQPLGDAMQAILLLPALPERAWSVPVDLTVAGPALLFAIAAYAIAWALEAGVRAARDLAGFV